MNRILPSGVWFGASRNCFKKSMVSTIKYNRNSMKKVKNVINIIDILYQKSRPFHWSKGAMHSIGTYVDPSGREFFCYIRIDRWPIDLDAKFAKSPEQRMQALQRFHNGCITFKESKRRRQRRTWDIIVLQWCTTSNLSYSTLLWKTDEANGGCSYWNWRVAYWTTRLRATKLPSSFLFFYFKSYETGEGLRFNC